MLASTLRCVMSTPFGSAVAPDVKMISTRSSRVTAAVSTAAASTDATASSSSPCSGQHATPPGSAGTSTSSPASTTRASTMARTFVRNSLDAR